MTRQRNLGFGVRYVEYDWGWGRWVVGLLGPRGREKVVMVRTNLPRERLANGIRVGTREERVEKTYGVRCRAGESATVGLAMWCIVRVANGTQMIFLLRGTCLVDVGIGQNCPSSQYARVVDEVMVRRPNAGEAPVRFLPPD